MSFFKHCQCFIHKLFVTLRQLIKTILINSPMRKLSTLIFAALAFVAMSCSSQQQNEKLVSDYGTPYHWEKGTIVVDSPERPAGQENVIGLRAPKLNVVRVGFVGLGMRGPGAVERFTYIPGVQIVALCDYEKERAERCQKFLEKASLPKAAIYSGAEGYKELCQREDIDLVYVATDWDHHFPVAKCALENGKHAAIEVPSAMNLEQCFMK